MVTMLFLALVLGFFGGVRLFAVMLFLCAIGAIMSPRPFGDEFSGWMSGFLEIGTGEAANVFSTIPLFIYAGYLMASAKTADRLVRVSNAAVGWMPGGLGIVTIIACALYTTFTGASGVTIVALGGLLMPALIKQGYPQRFSLGLVTGTGSVGLLFPPALPLFIFGTVLGLQQDLTKKWMAENPAWEWQTERFVWAGIIPGMVLVGMLSLVVVGIAVIKKVPRQRFDVGELGRSLLIALPELALPFLIIAALATGRGGIAQIASLTVVYLLFVEMVVYRDLKPVDLWNVTKESMALVGAIFIIVF
jgi:tripartite ATP-independent transporter DctM subunit